jgi:hypothetical protein
MANGVNRFHYGIVKSGHVICRNAVADDQAHKSYDKSSCLATVHLQQWDTVSVRRTDVGHLVEGGWWCSFSGFLISADP